MSRPAGSGLAHITIAAPKRRVDIVLPEHVPSAELLPSVLRHAGDGLADEGQQHGGWVLRRGDGSLIDPAQTLAAQHLRDGEVLHLAPRRAEWPEIDYDDVVDAIAAGARRHGTAWTKESTRRCGLAISAGTLAVGLGVVLVSGPDWLLPGAVAVGLAVVLAAVGITLSRAMADAAAGAVLAALALPYAFVGGALLLGGDLALTDLGAAQLLAGSAAMLVLATIGFVGVGDRSEIFVAGVIAGLLGAGGALLGLLAFGAVGAAAAVATLALGALPALPLLAIRLGKLPMPALPSSAEDLVRDQPMPPRNTINALVIRSDQLLTGMLLGTAGVAAVSELVLAVNGGVSEVLLTGIVAVAYLLRARIFPAVRQRLPLLAAGLVGLSALALGSGVLEPPLPLIALLPGLVVIATLVAAAGLTYSRRQPSPYLGRFADIFDVLLLVMVVPVACAVLGLFGFARGIAG